MIDNDRSIAILLATYNSGNYLNDQLDSLFAQTNQDWNLFVRDDGSSDDTLNILYEYSAKYIGRIQIVPNNGESLGAYMNFYRLLTSVRSRYYMFCDHDDVWLPNKISLSEERIRAIELDNPQKPIVVHTDMKVVDMELNIISESFWKYSRLLPEHTFFWDIVCCNTVNGCTMLFNNQAKITCSGNERYCLMHDTLVAQSVAAAGGIISAIKEPTVLYRQHVDNVIGAYNAERKYFARQAGNTILTIQNNFMVWKRACNIKEASFCYFLWNKAKITFLRILQ